MDFSPTAGNQEELVIEKSREREVKGHPSMTSEERNNEKDKNESSGQEQFDFTQLLETGRMLWPTYFQLAAMTFAWNASLAAGATFLFVRREASMDSLETPDPQAWAMITIAIIGVIYNAGALSAYVLMNRIQREVIRKLGQFPPPLSNSRTAELLGRYIEPKRAQVLKHLTHLFFATLCVCWLLYLIIAI